MLKKKILISFGNFGALSHSLHKTHTAICLKCLFIKTTTTTIHNDDIRANNFDKEKTTKCHMNQNSICVGFRVKENLSFYRIKALVWSLAQFIRKSE